MKGKVYILLGSNLGDRESHLENALVEISKIADVEIVKQSGVYNSPAMEMDEPAPDFLNQVVEIGTGLSPIQLLRNLKAIESALGRSDKGKYMSRNIDLDILLYHDQILNTEELTVPQKRLLQRPFATIPLLELAPNIIHPATHKPIRENLAPADYKLVTPYEEHAPTRR